MNLCLGIIVFVVPILWSLLITEIEMTYAYFLNSHFSFSVSYLGYLKLGFLGICWVWTFLFSCSLMAFLKKKKKLMWICRDSISRLFLIRLLDYCLVMIDLWELRRTDTLLYIFLVYIFELVKSKLRPYLNSTEVEESDFIFEKLRFIARVWDIRD